MTFNRSITIGVWLTLLFMSGVPRPIFSAGQGAASPATMIVVDTLEDDVVENGNCTLREAIQAASEDTAVDNCAPGQPAGPERIVFAVDGAIELVLGELRIEEDLAVEGNGRDQTVIDAASRSRIFNLGGEAVVELKSLALRGGFTSDVDDVYGGGAIYNASANLRLEDVLIEESVAFGPFARGGAVYSEGPLTMKGSSVSGCLTELGAGAVVVVGTAVLIENSVIEDNFIDITGSGAGLTAYDSEVTILDSLIAGNRAGSDSGASSGGGGAAIFNQGQAKKVLVSGSTITGNSARFSDFGGGGIYCNCDLTLIDSTIAHNNANQSDLGGGGLAGTGDWIISGSTLNDNRAEYAFGGAI